MTERQHTQFRGNYIRSHTADITALTGTFSGEEHPDLQSHRARLRRGSHLREVFGPGLRTLAHIMRDPSFTSSSPDYQEAAAQVNTYFEAFIQEHFDLMGTSPEMFIRQQFDRANSIYEYVRTRFVTRGSRRFSLRNKLESYSDTIVDRRLRFMVPELLEGGRAIDPELRHQAWLQLYLAGISAMVETRRNRQQTHHLHGQIDSLIDDSLWLGDYGETTRMSVQSRHDNITNTAISYDYIFDLNEPVQNTVVAPPSERSHTKLHQEDVRRIEMDGQVIPVLYLLRQKSHEAEVIKLLRDGFEPRNGATEPDYLARTGSIRDGVGLQFTVFDEDEAMLDQIIERVVGTISNGLPIDQAQTTTKDRLDPVFPGTLAYRRFFLHAENGQGTVPIELMFQTYGSYLKQRYQTRLLPNSPQPDGDAHELFEVRRTDALFRHMFFPRTVYDFLDHDKVLQLRRLQIEQDLLHRKRLE